MNLAFGTVFLAGLLTFLSPCVLPLIPVYLSVLLGGGSLELQEEGQRKRLRLLLNGAMFVAGFAVVFMLLGLTATAVGRFLIRYRLLFQQIGGLLVFLFALKFLGWLHIPILDREKRIQLDNSRGMSPRAAFLMGLTFAFGWTPCIGPVLGAVLTFTAVSTNSFVEGAALLLSYAAGVGIPLLVVAALAQPGIRLLNKVKRHIPKLEKATGVVLVAMAVLMVTDHVSLLTFDMGEDSTTSISSKLVDEMPRQRGETSGLTATAPRTGLDESAPWEKTAEAQACTDDGGCDIGAQPDAAGASATTLPRGPIVVDFFKPKCPACLRMAPLIDSLHETCSGRGLRVEKLNVENPAHRALAADLAVVGTPTLLFIDENGNEVSRLVGTVDFDTLHNSLAVLMGETCQDFTPL